MVHFREVCEEHGTIYGQCRCPSRDKTVRKVPCHCTPQQISEQNKIEYSEEEVLNMISEEILRLLKQGYRMFLDGDSMSNGDYWIFTRSVSVR